MTGGKCIASYFFCLSGSLLRRQLSVPSTSAVLGIDLLVMAFAPRPRLAA
eukprot:CAMPEP_0179144954 /NCGR_PEP_ID=MMETSP0796-20121207/69892_1 /TAXON_ID=73915 /ORGANISM="Pyrodinium bahamense, Strain pbaha01" /LENGTH=49 /DNA_ID= /DNA_START= /DNA_END= /DNA_ORIENTATION=